MAEPVYNILLPCPVDLVAGIDDWRNAQPSNPPRTKAIRELLRIALQQTKLRQGVKIDQYNSTANGLAVA
jgi:hypothetical protein